MLEKKEGLQIECKQTLRGSSPCAAVFDDSPASIDNGDNSLNDDKVNVGGHNHDV